VTIRVTFITPLAQRLGGSENMLWSILCHASAFDLAPRLVCLEHGPLVEEVSALGIPATAIETLRLRKPVPTIGAVVRLSRALRRHRSDIVVSWAAKAHLYGGPATMAAGLGQPAVWWQHNVPTGHWIDRLATALPAAAVGCSSHASADAQRRLRPRRRTFVVHPGAEPPSSREQMSVTREELGIPDDRLVVAIVGRLQPWKGQDRALEATAALRDRGLNLHLLVVGGDAYGLSPAYAERVRRLVGELGLEDRTTLTGQVVSAWSYMALSDVVVSASEVEPFGLVLVEAMMTGTAVLAVNAGGPAEIIEHGRSGWLIADGHPQTIASGLQRVLSDECLRSRLGAEGRRRAFRSFSAATMTERFSEALGVLANQPQARARTPPRGGSADALEKTPR
jgi:glycosyltransferase involved in cell wall biosynthesis